MTLRHRGLGCLSAGHRVSASHTCWTLARTVSSTITSGRLEAASQDLYLQAREVDMAAVEHGRYAAELKRACEAVRRGSALCQKIQLQLKQSEARSKSDASPVTVADFDMQRCVRLCSCQDGLPAQDRETDEQTRTLAARVTELVNDAVSSVEPSACLSQDDVLDLLDLGCASGGSQGHFWVLDPIDGTKGFVGMRQYAVCLGMIDQGQVVLGVLGCPNLSQEQITEEQGEAGAAEHAGEPGVGCLFAAQHGQGAFVGPLQGDAPWQRLSLQDESDFSNIRFMESYEAKHTDHGFSGQLAQALGITKAPLRIDSQAKYGALARGDAQVNLRFPRKGYREKIWDHCAGALIVQEAGGAISDAAGNPLDFGRGRWLDLEGGGIVSATLAAHSALLKAIAQAGKEV